MWPVYFHFSLLTLNILLWALKYRSLETSLRLLGLMLLLTLLFEAYAAFLMFNQVRNLHLFHILTPLQYVCTALIFRCALQTAWYRQAIAYSIPAFLVTSVLISLSVQGPSDYNSYALMLKSLLTTCWVLCYFREIFSSLRLFRLETEPMFWVSTGMLFYALGSFYAEGLMNYLLLQAYPLALYLYYFSVLLGYLLYGTFVVALVLAKPNVSK